MAEGDDQKGSKVGAEALMELFKEQTGATIELIKVTRALTYQIAGVVPDEKNPDGVDGLMDRIGGMEEAIHALDARMIGLNLHISRASYIGDKLLEIFMGNAEADPPVAPRAPTLSDVAAALKEYEKEVEEETALAEKEATEEEKALAAQEAAEDAAEAAAEAGEPPKPAMVANTASAPGFRSLPPLPVVEKKTE